MFREPWEAQAFAMALALQQRGLFTWSEWAATLADGDQARAGRRRSRYRRDLLPPLARDPRAAGGGEGRRKRRDAGALPRRLGPRRRPHAARHADRARRRTISPEHARAREAQDASRPVPRARADLSQPRHVAASAHRGRRLRLGAPRALPAHRAGVRARQASTWSSSPTSTTSPTPTAGTMDPAIRYATQAPEHDPDPAALVHGRRDEADRPRRHASRSATAIPSMPRACGPRSTI